jgi:hypothetical protein
MNGSDLILLAWVEAVYGRGDLFEKRRRLMDEWAKYCSGLVADEFARGPKGERRPADVIGAAVKVMRIATGEEPEDYGPAPESEGKNAAAVALGRMGGKAGAEGACRPSGARKLRGRRPKVGGENREARFDLPLTAIIFSSTYEGAKIIA